MRRALLAAGLFFGVMIPAHAADAPRSITYMHDHHIIVVQVAAHPEWKSAEPIWLYRGMEAIPPAELLTCGTEEELPPHWSKGTRAGWNRSAIRRTLEKNVASKIDREAGSVTISESGSGVVLFEGYGLTGRTTDLVRAVQMTITALETGVSTVVLPVSITDPVVTVTSQALRDAGIREVVTIGESVFAGSPVNRRHNIGVGVSKFNGHRIPQGAIFSFVEKLGPVNASTGYRKELVIQGETTIPDFGGGLCQVSSTAYRGPWEYGMPITQRKNHSYAVTYYSPQGTDATIYPPSVDMKFRNDTPGDLLIQSFVDERDRAYFIYYGTKDDRSAEVFGPYVFDRQSAPRDTKTLYTTDIPVGSTRKAGEKHDGMKVMWYRTVAKAGTGTVTESFFSAYQARPLTYQVGVTLDELARMRGEGVPVDANEVPSWIGE
ncbi:MAG: VanW family protein [Candidatus Peribacteraceae bacterium]